MADCQTFCFNFLTISETLHDQMIVPIYGALILNKVSCECVLQGQYMTIFADILNPKLPTGIHFV